MMYPVFVLYFQRRNWQFPKIKDYCVQSKEKVHNTYHQVNKNMQVFMSYLNEMLLG